MSPERHPIRRHPELPAEQRIIILEERLAQLWDAVWWYQLPIWRRLWYRAQGFRCPIAGFYDDQI